MSSMYIILICVYLGFTNTYSSMYTTLNILITVFNLDREGCLNLSGSPFPFNNVVSGLVNLLVQEKGDVILKLSEYCWKTC